MLKSKVLPRIEWNLAWTSEDGSQKTEVPLKMRFLCLDSKWVE
jgi:hypothetical protein